MFSAARPARDGAIRDVNEPSASWLRFSLAAIARACSSAMRLRVASEVTRTSPCLRRKFEISSAGDESADAECPESINKDVAKNVLFARYVIDIKFSETLPNRRAGLPRLRYALERTSAQYGRGSPATGPGRIGDRKAHAKPPDLCL